MMSTPSTELRILGPLTIIVNGKSISIASRKRKVILSCLLLAQGKAVPIERLVDAVWECNAPSTAIKQVRNSVSDLRSLLGPDVEIIPEPMTDGYRLNLASAELDVAVFDSRTATGHNLAREGRNAEAAEAFRSALSLWRGPVLSGLYCPTLEPDMVTLNESYFTLLEECVELELEIGTPERLGPLIVDLSRVVDEHPIRERFAVLLMRALRMTDERGRALLVYERVRRTLESDLGIRPGHRLRNLHAELVEET